MKYNYEINSDSNLDILVDLAEEFIKKFFFIFKCPILSFLIVIW